MRDEDKPFICYQQSRFNFRIVPRNAAGWRLLALWLLPLFAGGGGFTALTIQADKNGISDATMLLGLVLPFLVATSVWAFAMTRWMRERSHIITIK